jgi:threonine/homoserine/homoserine lactone efflux protein
MDYLWLIFSGVVMGLVAAVPIGPVNLICIRRTFAYGSLNGFVSGLGAALGDGVFAAVTGFGLTWVAGLIEGYSVTIELVGGLMMIFFAWRAFSESAPGNLDDAPDKDGGSLVKAMLSTFALTVSNPATLLFFTGLFAGLGGLAGGAGSFIDAGFVVAGVVGGSAGWWLVLTTMIGLFHARLDAGMIRLINRTSGLLVGMFGAAVLIHLALKLF